jgi:hypothetical protein
MRTVRRDRHRAQAFHKLVLHFSHALVHEFAEVLCRAGFRLRAMPEIHCSLTERGLLPVILYLVRSGFFEYQWRVRRVDDEYRYALAVFFRLNYFEIAIILPCVFAD